jgi:hypothetical protein
LVIGEVGVLKKAMVPSAQGLFECDALELDGVLWLVPEWLHNEAEGWMKPAWMIRLTGAIRYQPTPGGAFGDYIVNDPIPMVVFEGNATEADGVLFEVVRDADIHIPTGSVQ